MLKYPAIQLAQALVEHETLDKEEVSRVIKGDRIRNISDVLEEELSKKEESDSWYHVCFPTCSCYDACVYAYSVWLKNRFHNHCGPYAFRLDLLRMLCWIIIFVSTLHESCNMNGSSIIRSREDGEMVHPSNSTSASRIPGGDLPVLSEGNCMAS